MQDNRNSPVEYLTFSVDVKRTTEKAVLLQSDTLADELGLKTNEIWVPRSVIKSGRDLAESSCDVSIAEWWLEKQAM